MKPVFQTVKHDPPFSIGNCYRACVASILECEIDDIPPFETMAGFNDEGASGDEWWRVYTSWLADRGLYASRHPVEKREVPAGWSILCGASPRFPEQGHCVVAFDGEIKHDPFGESDQQVRVFWDFEVLIPLEQMEVKVFPIRILDHYYDGEWSMRKE